MPIHLLATCARVGSRVCDPSRSTGERMGGPLTAREGSVGLAGIASFKKEHARWIRRLISTASVTNQDLLNHSKLYTGPNPSVWLGLFIVGQLQAQRVMSLGWQRSVGRVWQDTSTWERRARFVIWHHYSFPSVAHFPGAAAQPQPHGVISTELRRPRRVWR